MIDRFRQLCGALRRLPATRWALLGVGLLLVGGGLAGWLLRPDPHLAAAERALQRREYAEAYAHMRECLKRWPDDPRTLFLAARTARRAALYEQAEEHLRACHRLQKGATDALALERALIRAQQGDPEVEPYLKARVEQGDPDTLLIWEVLIQQYLETFRLYDTLQLLDRYLERRPDDVYGLLGRGFVRERLFQCTDALIDYRRAVEVDPHNDKARLRLAETLLITGPPGEAAEHFTALQPRQPGNPAVLLGLARARRQLGQTDEARQLFDALLAEHPQDVGALTERGLLALDEGDLTRAEDWLRQAVAHAPSDRQALYHLYQCLQRRGSDAEVRECRARLDQVDAEMKRVDQLTQAVLRRPRDPSLRAEVGAILLRHGEEQKGLLWLHGALCLDPGHCPAHQALAGYYQRTGQTEAAERHRRLAEAKDTGS
jgi:predicted Zn-dependent protease